MLEIPWGVNAADQTDLVEARRVLDEDHEGLDTVKDRILEFLAVRGLRRDRDLAAVGGRGSGAILALVGLRASARRRSVSRSRALWAVRSCGSPWRVRDEAEIRGHRRTYVGARPGRIARALAEAGAMNPVVLIDEIDKVGSDWRGDPASALLEVLDPAQNHTFRDHYLEVDLDLSDILFLTTANVLETIPAPLLDRMELVNLDGYTEDEKVAIARNHLLPRQRERNGLKPTSSTSPTTRCTRSSPATRGSRGSWSRTAARQGRSQSGTQGCGGRSTATRRQPSSSTKVLCATHWVA